MKLEDLIISPDKNIKEALNSITLNGKKILMVEEDGKLVGVVTDGDIRRHILTKEDFTISVRDVMNPNPIVVFKNDYLVAHQLMKKYAIDAVPIVNNDYEIISLLTWKDIQLEKNVTEKIKVSVVIMAGGKGSRLYPYTRILPKPLIPIGEQTIIERILHAFSAVCEAEFYITVNYKKQMIKSFIEESVEDYPITLIEEDDFYGTAGSLTYLRGRLSEPFFVSNCDILIKDDYREMYQFHINQKNDMTIIASMKNVKIPYGVINKDGDGLVTDLIEKPEYDYLVNTGMYVLNPELLKVIPEKTPYHMTDLIKYCVDQGMRVGTYPVSEEAWLDMGQIKEMEEMIRRTELMER